MKGAYYNENDPKAAAWLRELIKQGLIAPGEIDERSILDVKGTDLAGFSQCHFFAGIGGWSLALRLAGWPDEKSVWTGSCPCQPFSVAGAGKGTADKRHLWPAFRRLIEECGPSAVFGEQVASADGRLWLSGVRSDLEGMGYGCGASDLCAAGVGAPHIRQRLYWVAVSQSERIDRKPGNTTCAGETRNEGKPEPNGCLDAGGMAKSENSNRRAGKRTTQEGVGEDGKRWRGLTGGCAVCRLGHAASDDKRRDSLPGTHGERQPFGGSSRRLADADGGITGNGRIQRGREHGFEPENGGTADGLANTAGGRLGIDRGTSWIAGHSDQRGEGSWRMGSPILQRLEGLAGDVGNRDQSGRIDKEPDRPASPAGYGFDFWGGAIWLACKDGKARRLEPGISPLANGVPARMVRLRGYGNAIVPPLAAEFILASEEAESIFSERLEP